jgi:hypothetical protein
LAKPSTPDSMVVNGCKSIVLKGEHVAGRGNSRRWRTKATRNVRDEAAGPPMRKDELAGQPQAVVPMEEQTERCAAEGLG